MDFFFLSVQTPDPCFLSGTRDSQQLLRVSRNHGNTNAGLLRPGRRHMEEKVTANTEQPVRAAVRLPWQLQGAVSHDRGQRRKSKVERTRRRKKAGRGGGDDGGAQLRPARPDRLMDRAELTSE